MEGVKTAMENKQNNGSKAWGWAIGINLVVFIILWFVFIRIPVPVHSEQDPPDEPGPGGTFGQLTHLVGDSTDQSTSAEDDIPAETVPIDTDEDEQPGKWLFHEFYLDRGPIVSFAPRLNPDGSLRQHPASDNRVKAPTYEDEDATFNSEDFYPPLMSPQFFSKLDLPEEYRELDFDLTVMIHVDARGRVLGVPEIIRSSGHHAVDEIVIQKIMHDVTFTPATHKETGEPRTVYVPQPIFFEGPGGS